MNKVASMIALTTFFSLGTLHADLIINEVCYANSTLEDETGDSSSDWIELYNSGPYDLNINNYGVADGNPYEEDKGVRLPDYTIPVGGYLLIYANGDLPEYTLWTNAPDSALIPENSFWRYRHSFGAPDTSWNSTAYLDNNWNEGISPLGYNAQLADMDCATPIGDTSDPSTLHTTAYFRKKFTVLQPALITNLIMRTRLKDGMIVYLNGAEVCRYNMPQTAIDHTTLANAPMPSFNWNTRTLDHTLLVRGINTLAVEIHKFSATGTALLLDLSLTALADQQIPIVHGQFGLKKEGEKAHLFNASLVRIDECEDPGYEIGENKSWGTVTDGITTTFQIYSQPTPGYANTTRQNQYQEILSSQIPTFSHESGAYNNALNVTISSLTPGYRIFYTLDGSDPRDSATFVYSGSTIDIDNPPDATGGPAWQRTNPIETESNVIGAGWLPPIGNVDRTVVLRAVTVSPDNRYCSPEKQATYFIGPEYQNRSLPVFSLITNPDNLFGFTSGLYHPGKYYADSPEGYGSNKWGKPYANYHQENDDEQWEHAIHFELFEPQLNTVSLTADMGFAMHGGGSRSIPQKSLYLIARNSVYGMDYINYPLFPELPAIQYKRFLLRNSGNDWYGATSANVATMLKDASFHAIISKLNIQSMAYRPALVYLNGIYWGIHNQRESFDKHYLNSRYNLDPDNIDILMHVEEDNGDVSISRIDGDKSSDEEYETLLAWIDANPLSLQINLHQLTNRIDLSNYTDYVIAETFFGNTDWPQNNCDFWRAHSNQVDVAGQYGDQRWRWMLYDLDVAGENGADCNMFSYLTQKSMRDLDEAAFLINELWSNMSYRNDFVYRYTDLLNSTFKPSHTSNTIANAAAQIQNEIETHFRRWGRSTTQAQWQSAVNNSLCNYLQARHVNLWKHLNSHFALGGTGVLILKNNDPSGNGGHLMVNGLKIKEPTEGVADPAQWEGTYFRSLPVTVRAIPSPGYEFDGWVGTSIPNTERTLFVSDSPTTLIARFRLANTQPYSATGYQAWLLKNYSEQQIIEGIATTPEAPSGQAGMSNFTLYAFGMNINDGLSNAQRLAHASLSIKSLPGDGLYVGFNQLNDAFDDINYTLKATDTLTPPVTWRTAVTEEDYLSVFITNIVNDSTWFLQKKLNPQNKTELFLKLDVTPQN